ncbi:MAG TPA: hypothetical protein VHE35_37280 [Kofleriaceae bacterium]|nr:hypothetical protein [Kofleriaceae bacterium]
MTGAFTVGGRLLNQLTTPRVAVGVTRAASTDSGSGYGWIRLGTTFSVPPVFVAINDESLNDSGATWIR